MAYDRLSQYCCIQILITTINLNIWTKKSNKGSGALPGKMLLVRILKYNKILPGSAPDPK